MNKNPFTYVSKVNIRFALFLFRFAYELVLILNLVVLTVEFQAVSNDIIFF